MEKKPLEPQHKLPISHPDYRYPTSRNPYWKKCQEFAGKIFSDNETEQDIGRWRDKFPCNSDGKKRELHVEVGCNAGHVVVEWAAANPNNTYVGIDWKFKPIFRGAEKGIKKGVQNLLFFRAHAERLPYMFAPGEIDFLYLFFPDPWAKKSQKKNRFVTPERLRAVHSLLSPGGVFHIKTDHLEYFEWMENAVKETAEIWEIIEHTRDLHAGHPDPTILTIPQVTLFEKLFIKDGIKINSIKLKKR